VRILQAKLFAVHAMCIQLQRSVFTKTVEVLNFHKIIVD